MDDESPLQLAIHCRLPEVVDALCTRGVDMSAPDRLGSCPLWAALDTDQENIAHILVKHGVDTDCWGPGPDGCRQTLLHRSVISLKVFSLPITIYTLSVLKMLPKNKVSTER